jgi:hypothetical protein
MPLCDIAPLPRAVCFLHYCTNPRFNWRGFFF